MRDLGPGRRVLLTTSGTDLWEAAFRPDDTLLLRRESAGVPVRILDTADMAIRISLAPGARSLNMAIAAAVAPAEAKRQRAF